MDFDFSPADVLPITREWLLQRVSEKEILDFYLGRSYDYGECFSSPFRRDERPSCSIFISKQNRPIFKDFAQGRAMDCFDVARKRTGALAFPDLLREIVKDMGLAGSRARSQEELAKAEEELKEKARRQKADIRVKVQPLQREDRLYLEQYGLNSTSLLERFRVYSPQYVWLNGEPFYAWSPRDPALAYYFGKSSGADRWKIYFYRRGERRFLGNTSRIQGWVQLPERDAACVLTKSLKDVMCLSLFDVPAVAMQGEMTIPYPYIIDELRRRFAHLFSLYDFDHAGISAANKLRKLYGIPALFLTNGRFGTPHRGAKDFSDLIRYAGMDAAKSLLRQAVRETGVKLTLPFEYGSSLADDRNPAFPAPGEDRGEAPPDLLQERRDSTPEDEEVPF